jgi:hypothetical protein
VAEALPQLVLLCPAAVQTTSNDMRASRPGMLLSNVKWRAARRVFGTGAVAKLMPQSGVMPTDARLLDSYMRRFGVHKAIAALIICGQQTNGLSILCVYEKTFTPGGCCTSLSVWAADLHATGGIHSSE